MMLTIGDLATQTGVSVRMLRHYDGLRLVRPVRIDEDTGYRWYAPSQVGRVASLLAWKGLGFTLEQCRAILDDEVPVEEVRDMLRALHGDLVRQREALDSQLDQVAVRLASIERGLTTTNDTFRVIELPALRLAQVGAVVNDTSEIPGATGQLFALLTQRLADAGVRVHGRGVRTYYGRLDSPKIDVAAGVVVGPDFAAVPGVDVIELPAEARGASVVHRGPLAEVADAWRTVDVAVAERGLESFGVSRQIFHQATDDDAECWVVELQSPVRELRSTCDAPAAP